MASARPTHFLIDANPPRNLAERIRLAHTHGRDAHCGEQYKVCNSALAALLKSAIFIAFPNSNRRVIVPFLRVAAVETLNGRQRPRSRKPKR